jgi:large subunit ribosomal protein L7/L12
MLIVYIALPCDKYTVVLERVEMTNIEKIGTIKAVRDLTTLGLKEAKELVNSAPNEVGRDLTLSEAKQWRDRLKDNGAAVYIKCQ